MLDWNRISDPALVANQSLNACFGLEMVACQSPQVLGGLVHYSNGISDMGSKCMPIARGIEVLPSRDHANIGWPGVED
jgi:hypothetical protein